MKVAQAKLMEIGPDDMNMEEYKVSLLVLFLLILLKTLIVEASGTGDKMNNLCYQTV